MKHTYIQNTSKTYRLQVSHAEQTEYKPENQAVVNALKSEIGKHSRWAWNASVQHTNRYEHMNKFVQPKKINRAYFKMVEVAKNHSLIETNNKLVSLHLCEGPGGFIEACLDICKHKSIELDWTGITLKNNDESQNIPDFKRQFHSENITYGLDGSGDITRPYNISYLSEIMQLKGGADLITADGGFDVSSDYLSQEQQSIHLFVCQVVSAILCQKSGGHFVMKIFDCHTKIMLDLLYILTCHYKHLIITKPVSSRPCNSEKYAVCKSFIGVQSEQVNILLSTIEYIYTNVNVTSLLSNKYSQTFMKDMKEFNSQYCENQALILKHTLDVADKRLYAKGGATDKSSEWISQYLNP